MTKPKSGGGFFAIVYLKEFMKMPKESLTRKQRISLIFGRLIEVPTLGVVWTLSKIPIVGARMERIIAQRMAKNWSFKPLPLPDTLSKEAIQYKKQKTLEINKKIDVETKILDLSTFNDIIDKFPISAISECGCRSVIMHCDAPKHTCLSIRWPQEVSHNIRDHSKYREPSKKELEDLMDLTDKWSLVHMALNYPDEEHTYVVCNCCDCCCVSFHEFKKHAIPMIVGSKYVAKIDPDKCTGCNYCINYRCRFDAIMKINEDGTIVDPRKEQKERRKLKWFAWSERRHGWGRRIKKDPPSWKRVRKEHSGKWLAKVDPNRCFGCGNCASTKYGCPEGAIQLYPRK